jgi:hypothetical protein
LFSEKAWNEANGMRLLKFAEILLLVFAGFALAQTQSDDSRSLGEVARETRERVKAQRASPHAARVQELVGDMSVTDPDEYRGQINELLSRQDFDDLEHAAATARATRSRFPGGAWKLYFFYDGVSNPLEGRQASDAEWSSRIAVLKRWNSLKPQSTTARIALAEAYLSYGRKARGNGYADTVTESGWQKFGQSSGLALLMLKEAAALPEKCPYWYEAMMQLAIAQGWSKAQAKTLVEESYSFEPSFYHVYREYANYLQPKWYGSEGEAEAFAEAISRRIGGEEGAFVYFEIATVLNCHSCGNISTPANLSWGKINDGYVALEHLYGTSNLKMNRFAFITVTFRDKSAARETFSRIGDDWNREVWRSRERFEAAKAWASN